MLGVAQLPPAVRFQTDHRHASQPTASVARPAALSNGRRKIVNPVIASVLSTNTPAPTANREQPAAHLPAAAGR